MYKALVVDDEPMILNGFDALIPWEEFGIEITDKAESGEEALRILSKKQIDLLITDIRMPGLSGLDLLRTLRQNGKDIKTIILSGYDDFQYVKEASQYGIENYLLKPIEEKELEETLNHLVEKLENEQKQQDRLLESYHLLKSNILYRWVTGSIGEEELSTRADFLRVSITKKWYQTCILYSETRSAANHLEYLEKLSADFWPDAPPLIFVTLHGEIILLFSWDGAQDAAPHLQEWLLKVNAKISAKLQTEVFIAIGSMEAGWQGAEKSYRKALELLEYRLILPANSVISISDLKGDFQRTGRHISWNKLDEFICAGDQHGACRFLESLFTELCAYETPEKIRTLTCEILFYLSKDFAGSTETFSGESLREILYTVDMQAILMRLQQCVEKVICRRQSLQQEKNPVVAAVLDYIQKHYSEELSLKTLALKYKVNAAYLGQLFKHETGEMFSVYLTGIRIENAKLLLRNTSLKANEISERSGFTNTNYFSNTFKKMTGVYPSEYRTMSQLSG